VTSDGTPEPKGINYRMHPKNFGCITAAGIDCCVLANNHVLDWGATGLADTLAALRGAGLAVAGAGETAEAAARPAVLEASGERLAVLAYGCPSSGVPGRWQAMDGRPGINVLPDLGETSLARAAADVRPRAEAGDLVVVSLHWGPNWGCRVPDAHRRFAHGLVEAGASLIFGHSSHHPMRIEVRSGVPILYGAGDLINDYEGIAGQEAYRSELVLAYFLEVDWRGLRRLEMVPFRIRRFRLDRASPEELSGSRPG
jgi:poly-gamma-glutamate capsule biosynthesis protein CapA/YwtB (metallophosphatase superfamily)